MLLNGVNLTKLESFVIKQRNQKEILGFLKSIQASDPKALVIVLAIFVYLVNKSFHSNMITINILFILHLIVINKFVTSQQSELSECNPNLYTQSSCIDMNKTYRCKCNPGFIWNGKSCVSTALDSYFEFQEKSTSSYIFYEKTFPKLKAFTLSTWLQIYDHLNLNDNKTLFTYSIGKYANLFRCLVLSNSKVKFGDNIHTRFKFTANVFESHCHAEFSYLFTKKSLWFHLTLTWSSQSGQMNFFFNGELKSTCYNIASNKEIKTAGNFILGQSHSEDYENNFQEKINLETNKDKKLFFDKKLAFVGRIFNFNIWNTIIKPNLIREMYQDCKLTYCGTASQWSDFRQGTRGNIKLRWPSNLLWTDLSCFNETYQQLSCNQYCNKKIGPICREQIYKNILWPLSKENEYAKVKCDPKSGQSNFASRFCQHYEKNEYNSDFRYLQAIASWNEPSIENCIQENFFKLKEEVRNFYRRDNFDERKIFRYLEKLYQFFMENIKLDPSNNRSLFDISTVIDTIFYLIDAQHQVIKRNIDLRFAHGYPSLNDTVYFCEFVLGLVDGILHTSKDSQIWSTSNPIGSESVRLFDVVKKLSMSLYDFQKLNLIAGLEYEDEILRNYMQSSEAQMPSFVLIEIKFSNIVFQQQLLFHENQMPLNFRFPDNKFRSKIESFSKNVTTTKKFDNLKPFENLFQTTTKSRSVIYRPIQSQNLINMVGFIDFEDVSLKRELMKQNLKKYYEPYALINVYYSGMENLVPNHNASFRPKDNNLNSIIISTELIGAHGNVQVDESNFNSTFDKNFQINFNFFNNFNISDTRCVYLKTMKEKFKWSRNECKLKFSDTKEATCKCSCVGTFSITNDLYDPMWAPLIVEIIPLSIISYIGCALVFTISICTLVGLKYFRTKSTTASVHTNLCISICLSQVLITISLSKFNFDSRICQSFALLNHYVFITIFAWLMNEAFNLYITITYAAHQTSPLNDSGSQWKFYLLGWLIPAIIVFIIFLTNSDDYFHDKMCWFNLDNIWINVSPALSILAISILVMVFSAKEHTEISYTKTEKSNKVIANHTKAVWTQIVLMGLCWSFGLLSFILVEPTLKYLYAFFNCLQASFLFIFYFLLNEEVRKKLRESKKLERLEKKEKKSQMSNLNDLIMETMFKIKRDEIDEEEEDDEEDEEEEQVETKTRNSFSKLYKSSQKNYIKSPTNDSKGNDLWLKSTNSKTVKFESPLSQGRNSHARDPLVLDLNSTAKKNEMMHLVLNPSDEDNRDYENQVWPHLKEKYYKNSSICLNKFNSVNLGADFYESNEEKITVL